MQVTFGGHPLLWIDPPPAGTYTYNALSVSGSNATALNGAGGEVVEITGDFLPPADVTRLGVFFVLSTCPPKSAGSPGCPLHFATCSSAVLVSRSRLTCAAPPGFGAGLNVTVRARGFGIDASGVGGGLITYRPPSVQSASVVCAGATQNQPCEQVLPTEGGAAAGTLLHVHGDSLGVWPLNPLDSAPSGPPSQWAVFLQSPFFSESSMACVIVSISPDLITCVPPPGSGAALNVSLTPPYGPGSVLLGGVSYRAPELDGDKFGLRVLEQAGGQTLQVAGTGFGPPATLLPPVAPEILVLFIGGQPCVNVTLAPAVAGVSTATCVTPPGVNASLVVEMVLGGQVAACRVAGGCRISYAAPRLLLASEPNSGAAAKLLHAEANYTASAVGERLQLCGLNLGNDAADMSPVIMVGGAPCHLEVTTGKRPKDSLCVTCRGMVSRNWANSTVDAVVAVGNQLSGVAIPVFPRLHVHSVTPPRGVPGGILTIKGAYFGRTEADLQDITIGGRSCLTPRFPSFVAENLVMCEVPLGSGSGLSVAVTRAGSGPAQNTSVHFAFASVISAVQLGQTNGTSGDVPVAALVASAAGSATLHFNVDIFGAALGGGQNDISPSSISVAGAFCASVQWLQHSHVRCLGLPSADLPRGARPDAPLTVRFTSIGGADVMSGAIVPVMGLPAVGACQSSVDRRGQLWTNPLRPACGVRGGANVFCLALGTTHTCDLHHPSA